MERGEHKLGGNWKYSKKKKGETPVSHLKREKRGNQNNREFRVIPCQRQPWGPDLWQGKMLTSKGTERKTMKQTPSHVRVEKTNQGTGRAPCVEGNTNCVRHSYPERKLTKQGGVGGMKPA